MLKSRHLATMVALNAVVPFVAMAASGDNQQYPAKPIRMIVGFAAGGATDIAARLVAQKMSEAAGVQVIVDNRPGAASMLGSELVARSAPDGYSILLANATIAMPSLFAKLAFAPEKDLQPVSLVGYGPLALTTHPSLPVSSVKGLIALAQRRPGEMNYASAGAGSFTHLAMALFVTMTGTNIVHVPYKGGAPSVIATMSGETQLTFSSVGASIPQVRQNRLRALAVSSSKRNNAMPDVPTVSESGVPGYEASSWYGMLAPSATPHQVLARLSELSVKALATNDLQERLIKQGIEPAQGGIDEFRPYFNAEVKKWAQVIKAAAIPPQ
jgi:tripartite-type tricarboxylate transporter receptor subunit TctC